MHAGSPDAVFEAITQSGNEITQGWMRLMESASTAAPWLAELQQAAARVGALQAAYFEKQTRLWTAMLNGDAPQLALPRPGDRRFSAREWRDNPYFDYLKQSYLLAAAYLEELVEQAQLEPHAKERARFAVRQWIDALCPANFPGTNPAAVQQAVATNGESLVRGMANLLGDARMRRISHSDANAFELGRNLGVTPGEVVYENELIQLIQYRPLTPEVAHRPLVVIPPCINKYYVLDLQPENSFVRHAVASGQTVFMLSWRNVGPEQGHLTWDDYLEKGVFSALRAARELTGADRVNALGFCVGGTLLGAALAVLAVRREALVASATFLAAMHDFSDAGQIGLFVDEASVAAREAAIGRGGVLPGGELAFVFSSLRANDLVWPYVVRNYLLGEQPGALDLLHWNADSTNLAGPMYCYYLRNTYLENRLRMPGALTNCGVPVDLGAVELPAFILATREDHIVPWRSAYRTLGLLGGGDKTFVLGASGHVAGIVNPPSQRRRCYWKGRDGDSSFPADPDAWLAAAKEQPGSWWPEWSGWLERHAGGRRAAPAVPGSEAYPPIEPAPGRYVKQRID